MAKKKAGGKGKADKDVSKAQRQEAKKAKQAQKGAKKDKKKQGEDEEEDIEALLNEFMQKDKDRKEVTVEKVDQPSPRSNFTMTLVPNTNEFVMFGGEYFDGDVNECFNDVFRWQPDASEWKQVSSPNTPPPRCSHQAAVFRDHLYIFGGEFATADQFHHYRDLWRLDLKTNAWEQMDEKGGPSPRSGHRMVVWRNFLVVFGGFYEAARETKWFDDLYLFSLVDLKWRKITFPSHRQVPAARSGCQLAVHPSKDIVFIYGGYAKVKNAGEKLEGKVYTDLWALDLAPVLKSQNPVFEKLSRKGTPPSPRSGCTVATHKQRFILFGGVYDEEQRRHEIQSTFFNDLFVYDMDRRRWFEFRLRGKKEAKSRRRKKKVDTETEVKEEEEEEGEDDFDRMIENQFGYVDEEGNIVYIEDEEEKVEPIEIEEEESKEEPIEVEEEESKEEPEEVKEVPVVETPVEEAPKPCARINPAICVRNSTLFVYGGMVEDGDREITLDDCWTLDLKKLDEWKLMLEGTASEQVWRGTSSDTEEEEEDSDEEEEDAVEKMANVLEEKEESKLDRKAIRAEKEKLQEQLNLGDVMSTPQMGENLRDFFARTDEFWASKIAERPDAVERQLDRKELKREGFFLAEDRYNELLPILERLDVLEKEQQEAEAQYEASKKGSKKRR